MDIIIIIIQHLLLRHISCHCGHSEVHYSLKHLHTINNNAKKVQERRLTWCGYVTRREEHT